jgi:hypothetical protein
MANPQLAIRPIMGWRIKRRVRRIAEPKYIFPRGSMDPPRYPSSYAPDVKQLRSCGVGLWGMLPEGSV